MVETKQDDAGEFITLTAETMMGDLRDFLLDRMKQDHNPLPWQMRSEKDQNEAIERATTATRRWVHRACTIIASGGQQAARGSLVKFQAKDGIQMQINVAASDPLRHALMDHVGSSVLVILADVVPFSGERAGVKVTKDQGDILGDDGPIQETTD